MADDNVILDLSTLAPERKKIRVDGQLYELAVMDDFGLRDQQWISSRARDMWKGLDADKIEELDEEAVEFTLDQIVDKIVAQLPRESIVKLSISQKTQILSVFIKHAGVSPLVMEAAETAIGESSSQDSKPSTTATPSAG